MVFTPELFKGVLRLIQLGEEPETHNRKLTTHVLGDTLTLTWSSYRTEVQDGIREEKSYLSTVVWFSISSGLSLWFSDLAACSLMQPNKVVPCFRASFSSSWFGDTDASRITLIVKLAESDLHEGTFMYTI